MKKLSVAVALLAAVWTSSGMALAKGTPDKVVIVGPGINGQIEVADTQQLANLGILALMDGSAPISPPAVDGFAFVLVRYGFDEGKQAYLPADYVIYYLNVSGKPGYIYYVGLADGWSEYDRKWFLATPAGDQTMRQILAENDPSLDGIQLLPAHSSSPARPQANIAPTLGIAGVILLVVGLAGWGLFHSRAGQKAK